MTIIYAGFPSGPHERLFYSAVRQTPHAKTIQANRRVPSRRQTVSRCRHTGRLLRSSANSTRHALLAENQVLEDESKDLFALLHQQFIDRINPTDGIEISLFNEATARRTDADVIAAAVYDLSRGPI